MRWFFVVWLLTAVAAGAGGWLQGLPSLAIPAILWGLVVLLLATHRTAPAVASFASELPTDAILTFHLIRFIGIYFLVLHSEGRLPWLFAVPGGWGDIAVASGALVLLVAGVTRGLPLLLWNAVGFADIIGVVMTAARLQLRQPGSMDELTHLPLSLLPTFVVPLILVSHLLLFGRLRPRSA